MSLEPPTHLPPFAALRAFCMVGRTGGIRKAAEALGVSHAIVSRHLSALEEGLGVLLLNRQTGQLTQVGQAYHAQVSVAIHELERATHMLRGRRNATLTIWCSAGFSLHWLASRLSDFSGRSRGRRERPVIDLRSTDSEPAFEANQADGDIRYVLDSHGTMDLPGVRKLELARPPVFPVASPAFIASLRKAPERIADLLALPLIQESSGAEWDAWARAQGETIALPPPVARYGQAHLTLAAARAGQGLALSNHFLATEDLRQGQLIACLPTSQRLTSVALGSYLFRAPRSRWSDPMLVRFRQWLVRTVALDSNFSP